MEFKIKMNKIEIVYSNSLRTKQEKKSITLCEQNASVSFPAQINNMRLCSKSESECLGTTGIQATTVLKYVLMLD